MPAFPALAAESTWSAADQVRARIISASDNIGAQKTIDAGIQVEFGEGWHSYWKMPGDSGLPPRFDWSASDNIEEPKVLYPAPARKDEAGLQVFGYADSVFFPLKIKLKDTSKPIVIDLALQIMVCKEICIPQDVHLALSIDNSGEQKINAGHKSLIDLEKRKVPDTGDTPVLKTTTVVVGKDALAVGVYSKAGFDHADLVAYTEDQYLTAPPKIEIDTKDPSLAMFSIPKPDGVEDLNAALAGKTLHLLVSDGRSAIEKDIAF